MHRSITPCGDLDISVLSKLWQFKNKKFDRWWVSLKKKWLFFVHWVNVYTFIWATYLKYPLPGKRNNYRLSKQQKLKSRFFIFKETWFSYNFQHLFNFWVIFYRKYPRCNMYENGKARTLFLPRLLVDISAAKNLSNVNKLPMHSV